MVFVGDTGAPAQSFPTYTNVPAAPVNREKPYLYVDGAGAWRVFVPAVQTDASATTWSGRTQAGPRCRSTGSPSSDPERARPT